MLIDHICVDTGNTLCQFTLSFFSFWIMDNYIDWSTLSCDTTHLPRYFSLWERSCPLYLTYNTCFPTSKNGVFCCNIVGVLWNFFCGIILSRICQRFIERELLRNIWIILRILSWLNQHKDMTLKERPISKLQRNIIFPILDFAMPESISVSSSRPILWRM